MIRDQPLWNFLDLWETKDLVKKGVVYWAGANSQVDICNDPWVPSLENFKPPFAVSVEGYSEAVRDLIDQDLKTWDIYKVSNLFPSHVAWEILKIKIPRDEEQNELMWLRHEDFPSNQHID